MQVWSGLQPLGGLADLSAIARRAKAEGVTRRFILGEWRITLRLSALRAMDCFAEPVIGRRFAPTRWLAMTASQDDTVRRVGKGALRAAPTTTISRCKMVGTLRFAHPTNCLVTLRCERQQASKGD
jgi:hypothetical protein